MEQDYLKEITREDIQKALKEFLDHGGEIKVLPSPKTESPHYVGSGKYLTDENIQNLLPY